MQLKQKEYDVIIVGSGGAGSAAAETAASQGSKVLLLSKDPILCSDSKISEGIITVRGSGTPKDTLAELSDNLRIQGDDIGNNGLCKAFSEDSPKAYNWLQKHGIQANIDKKDNTVKPLSIPMGGHTLARSVDHKNGGLDYAHACWNALYKGSLDTLEDAWFLDLYFQINNTTQQRTVQGGLVYHASTGDFISVKARSVVLACGGVSTLYYPNTDTMKGNTGDAYAIAARAGAKLVDMEQVQFIPFSVATPSAYQGLIVGEPISTGVLGCIKDKDGNVLKSELMGRTRAECAAVIAKAVESGKGTQNQGCYLDLTENNKGNSGKVYTALMNQKIPSLLKIVRGAMGPKAAKFESMWEVKPSAHYLMGGIKTNEQCNVLDQQDKEIKGLYAAGQALGGLHGSNRLGSTSLAEGIIFGKRAGLSAHYNATQAEELDWSCFNLQSSKLLQVYKDKLDNKNTQSTPHYAIHVLRSLQKTAWQGIGPARTFDSLSNTLNMVKELELKLEKSEVESDSVWNQTLIDYIECRNLLLCAKLIATSALSRPISLGSHVRLDHKKINLSKLFRSKPYSIEVYLINDEVEVHNLQQIRSPYHKIIKLRVNQNIKILVFKIIRYLPNKYKDAILLKIYQSALSEPVPVMEMKIDTKEKMI
ncbi:MAG: FAD-binding protein [Bermanella sp.]